MFTQTAEFYDAIYAWKDYAADVRRLDGLIAQHKRAPGVRLLDVCCGTGKHLELLRHTYDVQGLDMDPAMLAIARKRCPGVPLYQADATDFDLGQQFDVVTCLFSSIGYCVSAGQLQEAISTMERHLLPGGVLLVEPFIAPEDFHERHVNAFFVDQPDLKVARMNVSKRRGNVAILDFEYLIATSDGVQRATEHHELGLFSDSDFREAFAGLTVTHDREGLMARGLYIAVKDA